MTSDDTKWQDQFNDQDLKMMKLALKMARKAEKAGEIPIASILVDENGQILSFSHNKREMINSVIAHTEIISIHKACKKRNSWRLNNCTLYVTLEPCFMCAGALQQSRIGRVVFAAYDPKGGALGSLADLSNDHRLNHRFLAQGGLLEKESSQLLKNFFKIRRKKK